MLRSVAITAIYQAAGLFMSLLLSVLTARLFLPEGKADIAIFSLGAQLLGPALAMGTNSSAVFFLSRDATSQQHVALITFILMLTSLSITIVILCLDLQGFVIPASPDNFFDYALLASVVTSFVSMLSSSFLLSKRRYIAAATLAFLKGATLLAAVVAMFIMDIGAYDGVRAYITLDLGLTMLASMIAFSLTWNLNEFLRSNTVSLKTYFSYGAKSCVADLIQLLSYRSDLWIVLYFMGKNLLGQYVLAIGIAQMLWLIPRTIAGIVFPEVSGQRRDAADVARLSRLTLLFSAILSMFLGVVSLQLIPWIWGEAFSETPRALLFLLPGVVALSPAFILTGYLAGRDRLNANIAGSAAGLLTCLALDFILVPVFGLVGASIATSAAYGATLVVAMQSLKAESGKSYRDQVLVRRSDLVELTARFRQLCGVN